MDNLSRIIENAARLGAVRALESLGLTAGEITQSKAHGIYGKWFDEAVKSGRLHPCRVDESSRGNGRRRYRVVEIQEAYTADIARAELKFNNNQ